MPEDSTIGDLAAATTLGGTEVLPVEQGGVTVKATVDQIVAAGDGTYLPVGAGELGGALLRKTGQFVGPAWTSKAGSAFSTGFLRAVPFMLPRETAFDQIACEVTSGGTAGAVVRLGCYAAGADGSPGALVFDAGTVETEATGVKTIAIVKTLPADVYWLVGCTQVAASSLMSVTGAAYGLLPSSTFAGSSIRGWRDNAGGQTGALPATFPAAQNEQTSPILVQLRVA